jgi:biopolymer transport protein ExbD
MNYRKEIPIEYSEAENLEVTQADNNIEIWVDEIGNIYYKGAIVNERMIENIIVDAVVINPATRIHIIADKNTKYRNVNKIFEILKLLQHRAVSLVVKEKGT